MLFVASSARAEKIRLEYHPAEGCPAERVLRHAVAAEMGGVDPFSPDAKARVRVLIERVEGKFRGRYEVFDRDGKLVMPRTLTKHGKCAVAVEELGLSLGTHLPLLITAPTRESPPPAKWPLPAVTSDPAGALAPRRRFWWQLDGGPVLSFGTAPGTALGLAFHTGPRWSFVSLGIGLRGEFPKSTSTEPDWIIVSRIMLEGMLCAHVDSYFFGCGLVQIGQMTVRGRQSNGVAFDFLNAAFASGGVRLGHDFMLPKPFPLGMSVYVHGDVTGMPQRVNIRWWPYSAWPAPHVQGALGTGLRLSF